MKKEKNKTIEYYKDLINAALEELKTPGKRHRQIPNVLTLVRLLAPITIIPAVALGNIPLAVGLAVGFSLTDAADGFIARNWKLTSELGKDLDALADKLFAGTLLIAASLTNPILLMNVALEMIIARINLHQKSLGKETKSTIMGKCKTIALFTLAGLGITLPSLNEMNLINALSVVTAGLQSLTVNSYIKQYDDKDNIGTNNTNKAKSPTKLPPEEQPPEEKEYVKLNESEDRQPVIEQSPSQEEYLEQLLEMSEFLHQEKQNQLGIESPESVTTQSIGFQNVKS